MPIIEAKHGEYPPVMLALSGRWFWSGRFMWYSIPSDLKFFSWFAASDYIGQWHRIRKINNTHGSLLQYCQQIKRNLKVDS